LHICTTFSGFIPAIGKRDVAILPTPIENYRVHI
jgi:hypothetical protein